MAEDSRIIIRPGCLAEAGTLASGLMKPGIAAIISDSKVAELYGDRLRASLEQAGFRVIAHSVPPGEASKSLKHYGELLGFLADNRLTRQDCVFALGGGVVGDLAGFAAASYLRGIPLVQIPTTLLACVDSSVGGKTAIDPELLRSLSYPIYRDGLAEVVKTGAMADEELFFSIPYDLNEEEEILRRCVAIKQRIVAEDPKDQGLRQLLNFGHSFGHAIEVLSGFQRSHGECVAIGMAIIARASHAMQLCSKDASGRLIGLLQLLGLPTACDLPAEQIFQTFLSDKKRRQDRVTLVMLHALGDCRLKDCSLDEAREVLRLGMEA